MKTWVELTDLAGNIYKKKGSQARWVVHDVTLGAELILTPYKLNSSHLRFYGYRQTKVSQEDFFKNYTEVK